MKQHEAVLSGSQGGTASEGRMKLERSGGLKNMSEFGLTLWAIDRHLRALHKVTMSDLGFQRSAAKSSIQEHKC